MIGSIIAYTGASVPDGYLVCDGSAVSRTTYGDLYDIIGITYGSGDGVTTFNLPDLTGRVALGASTNQPMASNGGDASVTLTLDQIPSHTHVIPSHTHANTVKATTPSLSHTITQAVFKYTHLNGTTSITAQSANGRYTGTASANMTRSTNLAVSAHSATACTMAGSISSKTAFNSTSTGGGNAHNNLMPYLALTYLIRYEPDGPQLPRMLIYNGCMPVTAQGYYLVGRKS